MLLPVLIPTLLDFERSPGRFPLAKREPAPLFDQSHTVLLLAAGRPVDGLDAWDAGGQVQARRAARFFVRAALLRPGTDAYTVLGLLRSADADAIRSHYRLMIRLTHPDFSGGDSEWPADAATRINLANDVLSSASRRADLDRSLAEAATAGVKGSRATAYAPAAVTQHASRSPAARDHGGSRQKPSHSHSVQGFQVPPQLKMGVLAAGAVAAVVGLLVLNPTASDQSLVAREPGRAGDAAEGTAPSKSAPTIQLASADDDLPPEPVPRDPLKLSREIGLLSAKTEPAPAPVQPRQTPVPPTSRPPSPPVENPIRTVVMVPKARVTELAGSAPASIATAPAPAATQATTPVQTPPAAQTTGSVVAVEPAPALAATAVAPKAPRLPEVQPMLARIEQAAQRGLGVPLAMLVHPSTRKNPGVQKFVFDFQDALAGYRVTGLTRTDIDSHEVGDQLDVDLRMHFSLEDVHGSSLSRQVGVRARFGKLEDSVALVRMTVVPQAGGR